MALNLVRNSRVFFTIDVNATTGYVDIAGLEASKTWEIQVLDGFTFSQNTNQETVTLNETGTAPVRGQRSFNTSLAPVDFSMSTYIRPRKELGSDTVSATDDYIDAEEAVLWNALAAGDDTGNEIGGGNAAWVRTTGASAVSTLGFGKSAKNQLQKFGLIVILDNVTYVIDNCVLTQATIDFGIDAIATVAWTGQGARLRKLSTNATASAGTFGGGLTGNYTAKNTTAPYIANKLSTASISDGVTTYVVPLTGGSLTINNNVTYLTPANLGVVNQPATYFTGTRAISGTLNAYLKTGATTDTGALLAAMLADTSNVNPKFALLISIGGTATTAPRVVLDMPTSMLTIPTVDVQQVVSTAINFTAQGANGGSYDITADNELSVKYYAA